MLCIYCVFWDSRNDPSLMKSLGPTPLYWKESYMSIEEFERLLKLRSFE